VDVDPRPCHGQAAQHAEKRMVRRLVVALALVAATLALPRHAGAVRDTTPGNTVVDFARFGDWEVWCIRLVKTGAVVCDLNNVLNYVPNPNFRGLIPRVYLDADGLPYLEIETEFQTSLEQGWIETTDGSRFPFAGCGRPCRIDGDRAAALIALLGSGGAATLRLYDYFIEAHDVPVDLGGFGDGLATLKSLHDQYRD
jgi:invasion protein IalB